MAEGRVAQPRHPAQGCGARRLRGYGRSVVQSALCAGIFPYSAHFLVLCSPTEINILKRLSGALAPRQSLPDTQWVREECGYETGGPPCREA